MSEESTAKTESYTVVARRYRPRTFSELIGQEHIAQALSKAIASGRVGHAYLFTGARGVGKTSTARIFAKALNAPDGKGSVSDIASAIETGEDMDVIEIDGASNRGIEEIRQLRANVTVRPSRAKYKIYIIDEVHMLTNQAFNALLKTLEEPPEHVKFIFCTTDPDKLPITVLSRCQRFDFVPVKFEAIQQRLKEISKAEGFEAEDEALALLARKAAGSMRDSQSLLEQVMSFSNERITADQVHALLGTADESRLMSMVEALVARSPLAALAVVSDATREGADPGQLAEQLLNFLRDLMTAGIGGGPDLLKLANPTGHARLAEIAKTWGVQTILAAIQILDESLVRMRSSVSSVTLLEVALVQICQLQDLAAIPAIIDAITRGGPLPSSVAPRAFAPAPTNEKKNVEAIAYSAIDTARAQVDRHAANSLPSPVAVTEYVAEQVIAPEAAASSGQRPTQLSETHSSSAVQAAPVRPVPDEDLTVTATPPAANALAEDDLVAARPSPATPQADVAAANPAVTSAAVTSAAISTSGIARRAAPDSQANNPSRATPGSPAALEDWRRAVGTIDGMLADFAGMAQSVDPQGSDQWNIYFPPGGQKTKEYCEAGDRKGILLQAVERTMGRAIRLNFIVPPGPPPKMVEAVPQANVRAQKIRELAEHPMVKKISELLGGEIIRVDSATSAPPTPTSLRSSSPVEHAT